MPCYSPLKAWYRPGHPAKFEKPNDSKLWTPGVMNCRHCIGCKTETIQEWTNRAVFESQIHKENMFLTLTYGDEHLPTGFDLIPDHVSSFIKKMRVWISRNVPENPKIKFRVAGEYGESYGRPHYHFLIHGWMPPDLVKLKQKQGKWTFKSEIIENIWKKGHNVIGNVEPESAAYVNQYISKKFVSTEEKMDDYYTIVDPYTGEKIRRHPEFARTSQGYGKSFYEKFKSDLYPHGFGVVKGNRVKIPKYFDELYKAESPESYENYKEQRKKEAISFINPANTWPDRQETIKQVKEHNLKIFRGGEL